MKTALTGTWRKWMGGMLCGCLMMAANAADPLVNTAWVKANLGAPDIVYLDLQPPADYQRGHIPGAVNSSFAKDGWREDRVTESNVKVPDMLPVKLDALAAMIGKLGIDNATHVVLAPPGASFADMGMGTRIYWTFKVLGHDKVSILDGGMAAWMKDKNNPLQTGAVTVEPKTFKVNVRQEMIVTLEEVKKAQAAGVALIDDRTEDQYVGINRHPKAAESGTIEGAKNLPGVWLTVNGGGEFRNSKQLEQLYEYANVPLGGEQIYFCNTGHLGSIGWFVASELLGNPRARLYDGSMTEWTLLKGGPVARKITLD